MFVKIAPNAGVMADEAKLPIALSVEVELVLKIMFAPVVALPLSVKIRISLFDPPSEVYCQPLNPVALTGGVDK